MKRPSKDTFDQVQWEAYCRESLGQKSRMFALSDLSEFECGYKASKNPLFVWEAIRLCEQQVIRFPKWIMDYLKDAAELLLQEDMTKTGKNNAAVITEALDMPSKKGRNPFTEYKTAKRKLEAFIELANAETENPEIKAEDVYRSIVCEAEREESCLNAIRDYLQSSSNKPLTEKLVRKWVDEFTKALKQDKRNSDADRFLRLKPTSRE